jgi:hypothetical protein
VSGGQWFIDVDRWGCHFWAMQTIAPKMQSYADNQSYNLFTATF